MYVVGGFWAGSKMSSSGRLLKEFRESAIYDGQFENDCVEQILIFKKLLFVWKVKICNRKHCA